MSRALFGDWVDRRGRVWEKRYIALNEGRGEIGYIECSSLCPVLFLSFMHVSSELFIGGYIYQIVNKDLGTL